MSLNAKIGAFVFAFGLVLACFLSVPVYSAPAGVGIESNPYYYPNSDTWYVVWDKDIPIEYFPTDSCGYDYFSGNYGIRYTGKYFDSNDVQVVNSSTQTGVINPYSDYEALGYFNTTIGATSPPISQMFPSTGNYYFQIAPASTPAFNPCTPPVGYVYFPFHVDLQTGQITSIELAEDGLCGLDNGAYLERTPPTPPLTLCQKGNASDVVWFPYEGWAWTCYGENGGTNDSCIAYITAEPVDAVCGLDNGQTLDNPPENFCLTGNLIVPSYLDTITGYTWICSGFNGGSQAYCSASKGNLTPPILPEMEDCTLLDIPDRWFCQISNAIQNAFLPTSDKLDELNVVVNQIQQKFPFNYISFASDKFSYISGQVSDGTLSITILGNSGTVNLGGAGIIAVSLKTIMYFWISSMFIFWALGYIKHFFK